jgi:WD40 repeat protein
LFAAGYDNGIVRIFNNHSDNLILMKGFKAHEDAIVSLLYSDDLKTFVTASKTGDIFFYKMDGFTDTQLFIPICTVKLPNDACINDGKFSCDQKHVIFSCENGRVHKVRLPREDEIDNSDSFLWENPDLQTWTIKLMDFQMKKNQKKDEAEEELKRRKRLRGELPKEDEEIEEIWEPQSLGTVLPFVNNEGEEQFIVSSRGQFNGWIYIGDFNKERPLRAIKIIDTLHVTYMNSTKTDDGELIFVGYDNGLVEIVANFDWGKRLSNKYHDGRDGQITAAILDRNQRFFITSSKDGLIYVHKIDIPNAFKETKFDPLLGVEGVDFMAQADKNEIIKQKMEEFTDSNLPLFANVDDHILDEASLAISIKNKQPVNEDITDPTIYSIQQAKLRTEEDHRLQLAEKKKTQVRNQINKLREWFNKITDMNEHS